ncbi:glycosyltransferase family 2 protein [Bacillus sp. JJ1566]|uniref:glycosyltransferase family 2 protein n=1 Tax=Bacillus sp. JJ1566 TaxID=3122961 RepID=UPI002FFE1288
MKVSVITVSYNSEKTIEETIKSVKNQSYEDIEYILVDGKSNDSTIDIIKKYESFFKNTTKDYRWISEKDSGIYDAINKGIKLATGDVIGILNSDDFFCENSVIADIVDCFKSNNIDCLYGNMVYINAETRKVKRRWISREFNNGLFEKSWTPGHPTFYCKSGLYHEYGLYRTDFKIAADVELMYRFLVNHNINSYFMNKYMVVMRQGGVSSSGLKSTLTITKEMKKAIEENGGNFNLAKYLFYKALKIKEFLLT